MVEFPYLLPPDRRWMQVGIWLRGEVVEQLVTSRFQKAGEPATGGERKQDEIAVTQCTHTTLHATHAAHPRWRTS
jgi:hypothetical protein